VNRITFSSVCASDYLDQRLEDGSKAMPQSVKSAIAIAMFCASTATAAPATARDKASHPSVPLAWEKQHPERKPWSIALRAEIGKKLDDFDRATDLDLYCPRYRKLSTDDRVSAIAAMAVAIAKFESGYNPKQHFGEPPPLGYDSIGLFQLSYEDGFTWCELDRGKKSLEDPINNIRCAVPEMARLIAKDGVVAAGTDKASAQGLARYWSVVREGAKHHLQAIRTITASTPFCLR